jgi:collagenase-like PrtC family protease
MKFCVATTWDDRLIHGLKEIEDVSGKSKIYELFGSLPVSAIGSGREAVSVPTVSREKAANHIELAHSLGIRFNYLINTSCMGNREFSSVGYNELMEYLGWINEVGVDTITVTIPLLIGIVRSQFPKIEINVSTINHVRSVSQIEYFRKLGANRITLSYMSNRDFELMRRLKSIRDVDFEILINESCLLDCPFRMYHYNLVSHGSQGEKGKAFLQYPFLSCTLMKLQNVAELIKAPWVRPEDLYRYEDLGIRYFKLSGREKTTEWLLRCAKSYFSLRHNGNLLDIIAIATPTTSDLAMLCEGKIELEFRDIELYIDNNTLTNFLEFFEVSAINCESACGASGIGCLHCYEVANAAIRFNWVKKDEYCRILQHALSVVRSGQFVKILDTTRKEWEEKQFPKGE